MSEVKTKKRKVSKKTKNSWRKHIDIKDVDAFLDKKRLEERLGIFSERPDSDFFTIENIPKKAPVSKYVARLALKNKEPTCFANLKPHTQVPDPISKRNRIRTKEEKKSKLSLHYKTSIVSAIEAPHSGTSYNPSYTDHQQVLQEVGQHELKIMKQEAHLNRVTNKMFKKVSY